MNPKGLKKDEYDVIIIGAGIGGLVCGCYLAKAGMKVLIVEQHYKVGGYCQSFIKNGFIFESGPHALSSLRDEEGQVGIIFRDLGLGDKVKLIRNNPSDLIVTPDFRIAISTKVEETIANFQQSFPDEASGIKSFFEFINKIDTRSLKTLAPLYIKLKGKTFCDLLDYYFSDDKLKAVLTMPLSGLTVPATMASAMTAAIYYKEFILDGGHYVRGGTQIFVDALADVFSQNGGEILLSTLVDKIVIKNNKVEGVKIKETLIKARYVVSNCDARQTFFDLCGVEYFKKYFIEKLNSLVISSSGLSVYLGINKKIKEAVNFCQNNWIFSDYNADRFYESSFNRGGYDDTNFALMIPSLYDSNLAPKDSENIRLFINAAFLDKEYIEKNKELLIESAIKKVEKLFPEISGHIIVRDSATPFTLHKYTLNSNGCIRGWAALPSQDGLSVMQSKTPIENLFLASHWVTDPGQGGVGAVVFSGRNTANLILKKTDTIVLTNACVASLGKDKA